MSDANEIRTTEVEPTERSTRAVFGILGALLGVIALTLVAIALATSGFSGGGTNGSADLAEGVNDERIQAVYMSNDRVYFGKVREGTGDWVVLEDAYYLRQAAADAAAKGDQTASKTEIVPVTEEIGGTGDLRINTAEITLVQDLAARSEISTTIEDATK